MGQSNTKPISGSMNLLIQKSQYISGEMILGMVSYEIKDPQVHGFIQLLGEREVFEGKNSISKELFVNQVMEVSQPNEFGKYDKPFCIPAPQISSIEFSTGKYRISIKYFLVAYLNFKPNEKLKQEINHIEQIHIQRPYQQLFNIVQKVFRHDVQSWFFGNIKPIQIAYNFPRVHFKSNECIDYILTINNTHSSTNLKQVEIQLVFEMIERKRGERQRLIQRKIISRHQDKINVPFGIEREFQISLPISGNCLTSNYMQEFKMWYHVEMSFYFESLTCDNQLYMERVLVDVVNCEKL